MGDSESNKLVGFYRGKVLKQMNHGKCKIYIPGVYDEIYTKEENINKLPSAEPATPIFGGTNNANGVFSYPNLGSTVWCFFANGDQNFPIFFAATLGGIDAKHQYNVINGNEEDGPRSLAKSIMHRITSGDTTLTLQEDGVLHARTSWPLDAQANHKEVETSQYSDLQMLENGNITVSTGDIETNHYNILDINSNDKPATIKASTSSSSAVSKLSLDSEGVCKISTTGNGVKCSVVMSVPEKTITLDISGGGNSTVVLGENGNISIKSSAKISLESPTISLTGSDVSINGSSSISVAGGAVSTSGTDISTSGSSVSVSGGSVSIDGGGGDCVISGKSLVGHSHIGNMGSPTSPPL